MNHAKETSCCCADLPDLAAVPVGGDGRDEGVFATLENVCDHGGDLWWLYLSKCSACGQAWMIAQEERIFDEYFLRRVTDNEVANIKQNRWPDDFISYERVLKIGHLFASPCIFLDSMSSSLVWSAHDLQQARPDISVEEIAHLLGVTVSNAKKLLKAIRWIPIRPHTP